MFFSIYKTGTCIRLNEITMKYWSGKSMVITRYGALLHIIGPQTQNKSYPAKLWHGISLDYGSWNRAPRTVVGQFEVPLFNGTDTHFK